MRVEIALSLATRLGDLKRIRHRLARYIQAHLAFVSAMFNVLLEITYSLHPEADPSYTAHGV